MLKERLQILVDRDQRRRLDEEAARRQISVGALVRTAIDAELGGIDRERRVRAVDAMAARARAGSRLSPEELDQILDEERQANVGPRAHGGS